MSVKAKEVVSKPNDLTLAIDTTSFIVLYFKICTQKH